MNSYITKYSKLQLEKDYRLTGIDKESLLDTHGFSGGDTHSVALSTKTQYDNITKKLEFLTPAHCPNQSDMFQKRSSECAVRRHMLN